MAERKSVAAYHDETLKRERERASKVYFKLARGNKFLFGFSIESNKY